MFWAGNTWPHMWWPVFSKHKIYWGVTSAPKKAGEVVLGAIKGASSSGKARLSAYVLQKDNFDLLYPYEVVSYGDLCGHPIGWRLGIETWSGFEANGSLFHPFDSLELLFRFVYFGSFTYMFLRMIFFRIKMDLGPSHLCLGFQITAFVEAISNIQVQETYRDQGIGT